MLNRSFVIDTASSAAEEDWILLDPGFYFLPLHFSDEGWTFLLRLEPGTLVPTHRHTGESHAINLSGHRELVELGVTVGPGSYVFEPVGTVDSWRAVGDEPCVIHLTVTGDVQYLNDDGSVAATYNTNTQRVLYTNWMAENRPGIEVRPEMVTV
ncbi:MAG: 2,4-dihydroxyacetophenone dioxygenase [Ilumatobacteraceae bacterium]|jgi:quercetin dioxygenase-like cupin family protein